MTEKEALIAMAALDFPDADVGVQWEYDNSTLVIRFRSAYDSVHRTFVDGRLLVSGWDKLLSSGEEVREGDRKGYIERVCEVETVGDCLLFRGFLEEGSWYEWCLEGFGSVELTVERRAVWEDDEKKVVSSIGTNYSTFDREHPKVLIETPDGHCEKHKREYARRCTRDSYGQEEAPIIPKGLEFDSLKFEVDDRFTGRIEESRRRWLTVADAVVFYTDFGSSEWMREQAVEASREGVALRYRRLFSPKEAREFTETCE